MRLRRPLLALLAACLLSVPALAEIVPPEDAETGPFDHLEWRNVGPVNMSGRVTDVEGVPGRPQVVYVGAASGGVWKTTDGGLTFKPLFDDQPNASIGDLALAPSNPEVIYVGTGESNTRNSVSFGNGVYKSTDGGASWRHLGLEETRHVSRVLVHPHDPDVVYVGAVGHIFGPNEERGVFRSRDGGETWEKVLYLDERHGVADLDLDASNPNVLFAALWHFERKPWTFTSGGEEGGVYRSVDGGATWKKLTEGLPKLLGRIGVKIAPSNPDVVYVIAESNEGVLFRSDDRGDTFRKVSDDVEIVSRGFYYTDLRVDPSDEDRVYAVSSRLFLSIDGGRSFERIARNTHVDYHSLWIDPLDPRRLWQGQDGGVAVSYDRGVTWEPIRNLPIAQFYQVFHDHREPFYALGGGLQDNGTWYGPSRTREPAGILEDDWRMISFGDAYFTLAHPTRLDTFLSESQGGGIVRTDMVTRQQIDVSPQPRRNDGGPVGELEYRFNWNSPIVASPHAPETVYFAGNVVFRSTDFGDSWSVVSPDLTTDDPEKQKDAGGPVWPENTTAEYHCTIISFAESPAEPGVLWAGTDDGNLQVSRDGGGTWTNVVGNVPGMPAFSPVSHVEPSRTAAGTAYAAFDRHMFDDFHPHVFKTADFGATWTRLDVDVEPASWVWVVREDPKNPDLLYAGTELGLVASYDAGGSWQRLHLKNLPTVSVHDLLVHPRENDLILGTHGRAIWILDDATPVQQWRPEIAAATAHLFPVRPALRFPVRFTRYGIGDKEHRAPNPPYGALISFFVKEEEKKEGEKRDEDEDEDEDEDGTEGEERVKIQILDGDAAVIRTLKDVPQEGGLRRMAWDLRRDPPRPRSEREDGGSDFRRALGGPEVLPGTYAVRLTVAGESWETPVAVGVDPLVPATAEGLAAQHEAASRLTAMQSTANDVLRGTDAVGEQLAARRATVKTLKKDLTPELEERWKAFEEKLKGLQERLVQPEGKPFWSQGPRLLRQIGGLMGDVDTALRAPTPAQARLIAELEAELGGAVAAWNVFVAEDLAALNAALSAADVPPLASPGSTRLVWP